MKKRLILLITSVFISGIVVAEQPEWAGKGKPTAEERAEHKAAMQAKDATDEMEAGLKEKVKNKKPKKDQILAKDVEDKVSKGLESQKAKKSNQIQNEIGKGSEKGQEASSVKRKWWKFWE